MRKSWVYCPKAKKLVPKEDFLVDLGVMIMADLPDVLSPVTGKVIHGRSGMRNHNKDNNVTFTEDFREQWAQQAKDRAAVFEGKSDKNGRRRAIAETIDRLGGYTPGSKYDFR